jgi:hypothetical protein
VADLFAWTIAIARSGVIVGSARARCTTVPGPALNNSGVLNSHRGVRQQQELHQRSAEQPIVVYTTAGPALEPQRIHVVHVLIQHAHAPTITPIANQSRQVSCQRALALQSRALQSPALQHLHSITCTPSLALHHLHPITCTPSLAPQHLHLHLHTCTIQSPVQSAEHRGESILCTMTEHRGEQRGAEQTTSW